MSSLVALVRRPPFLVIGMASSVTAPPCQMIFRSATRVSAWMVTTTSQIAARSSCLRSGMVVPGAWNTAAMSAPAVVIQASSSLVSETGRRACWARRSFSACRAAASLSSQARSRVRATSRFSGSTASYWRRARLGFVAGALDGQLEDGQALPVVVFGFGQRFGGGLQRRPARGP